MSEKKILIFGKTGQLGWELQRTLAPLGAIKALSRDDLDLSNLQSLRKVILDIGPHIIVNASAYTNVDRAEEEPDIAEVINYHAPAVMAETAKTLQAVMIHYSTDYVFDGKKGKAYTEEDTTKPLNVYGLTKLKGEQAIRQIGGMHIILRTSWVYSIWKGGFVSKILYWARKNEIVKIVTDQIGSPTWSRMLAEVSSAMIARSFDDMSGYFSEKSGIYHIGSSGSISRFEFSREILRLDPHPEEHLIKRLDPALTDEFPSQAIRPLFTALDCSHFERTFGLRMPDWREVLILAMDSER